VKQNERWGLIGLGLALAWAMFKTPRASSTTTTTTTTPAAGGSWPIVARIATGTTDRNVFDRQRFDAILAEVDRHNAPASVRVKLARALLARCIMETGRTGEGNWNVAFLRPNANWHGSAFRQPGVEGLFRAYPSLAAGVTDYVNSSTNALYGQTLGALAAGSISEAEWYAQTIDLGWSTSTASLADLATFETILTRLRAEFPG
jgi:hypothetical protein